MNSSTKNKIVIIGAGPSGSVTSLFLSKYKIPHVLIDKETFPRHKPCGESFVGRIFNVLDDVDPSLRKEMYERGIVKHAHELSFYTHDEQRFIFKIPQTKEPKIQAERYLFDEFLVRKAAQSMYCEFWEGVTVKNVTRTKTGVSIEVDGENHSFSVVGFATGAVGNLINKFTGNKHEVKGKQFLLARGIYEGGEIVNENSAIDFTLLKEPFRIGTYVTGLPGGKINFGVMVQKEILKNQDCDLKSVLPMAIENHPYLNKVLKSAELKEYSSTSLKLGSFKKSFAGDNYLLIGDAAAPMNPITGMGVMMAMFYARNAAMALKEAYESDDFSFGQFKKYDHHCSKKYKSEFKKSNFYTYLQTNKFRTVNKAIRFVNGRKWWEKIINRLSFGK